MGEDKKTDSTWLLQEAVVNGSQALHYNSSTGDYYTEDPISGTIYTIPSSTTPYWGAAPTYNSVEVDMDDHNSSMADDLAKIKDMLADLGKNIKTEKETKNKSGNKPMDTKQIFLGLKKGIRYKQDKIWKVEKQPRLQYGISGWELLVDQGRYIYNVKGLNKEWKVLE